MVSFALLHAVIALAFSSFTSASPALERRATVSPDGTCGGTKGYTCQGSNFGNSCGRYNLCGRDPSYSELSQGCQPAYGFCYPKGSVSPDGTCGGSDMFICLGSNFGNSCGPNNRCGSDAGYSGTGCQPQYGYCQRCTTTVPPSTTTLTSTTTSTVPVTASTSTTVTVASGVSSVTTTTTTTSTATVTTSSTTTTTTVTTLTLTSTVTTTGTTTIGAGTTTVTITTTPVFQKRDSAPTTLAAPRFLEPRAAGLSCGTVISTGFTTTTVTTTKTVTTSSTTTQTSTSFTTTPTATTTLTSTVTASTTTTTTAINTSTLTLTAPATFTTITVTSFSTVTTPATTVTATATASPLYSQVYKETTGNNCFFQGTYYHVISSGTTQGVYQDAEAACFAACSADSNCKSLFFDYLQDSGGNYDNYCFLIAYVSSASDIACGYTLTSEYMEIYKKN